MVGKQQHFFYPQHMRRIRCAYVCMCVYLQTFIVKISYGFACSHCAFGNFRLVCRKSENRTNIRTEYCCYCSWLIVWSTYKYWIFIHFNSTHLTGENQAYGCTGRSNTKKNAQKKSRVYKIKQTRYTTEIFIFRTQAMNGAIAVRYDSWLVIFTNDRSIFSFWITSGGPTFTTASI